MQQSYFYLTITDNGDNSQNHYNAHTIKERYDLKNFDAYNQGEKDSNGVDVVYNQLCLRFPSAGSPKHNTLDFILHSMNIGRLLTLPKGLKITVHFVTNSTPDSQCCGYYLGESTVRDLAMLNADFIMYGQLHKLPLEREFACAKIIPDDSHREMDNLAEFFVRGYRHTIAEIGEKLGFFPNHKSQDYNALQKHTNKPWYVTQFVHTSSIDRTLPIEQHIKALTDELYLSKDKILRLGDDIDISYHFGITGTMPNAYQFTIDSDSLMKLAKMRMGVDIDMYFVED